MRKVTLKKIQIENFRSIKKLEIDLTSNPSSIEKDIFLGTAKKIANGTKAISPFYAIFGRNSAGKTTLLNAISFFKFMFNNEDGFDIYVKKALRMDKLMLKNFSDNPTKDNVSNILEEVNKLDTSDGQYWQEYTELYIRKMRSLFHEESMVDDKDLKITLILDNDDIEQIISLTVNNMGEVIRHNKNPVTQDYVSNIIGAPETARMFNRSMRFGGTRASTGIETALMGLWRFLNKTKLLKLLKLADENIDNIVRIESKHGVYRLQNIIISKKEKTIKNLSTGTQNYIKLLWLLLTHNKPNSLIYIDEIDSTLHMELVDVLKIIMINRFEKYNIQTIFTSHSPLTVHNYTKFKQIYSLNKDKDDLTMPKLSNNFKNGQNIVNRYLEGDLSQYPMAQKARNTIADILND